jgi:hypothetical protein
VIPKKKKKKIPARHFFRNVAIAITIELDVSWLGDRNGAFTSSSSSSPCSIRSK